MKELKLEEGTYTARRDQDGNIVLRLVEPRGATSPLAKGHNPAKLTEEQVGVEDGWRLLAEDEIDPRRGAQEGLECWNERHPEKCWTWNINLTWAGNSTDDTYRTKRPVGHFRPAPVGVAVADIDSVLVDLKVLNRAVSFGHPHEVIEQMIRRYENLKLNA